MMDIGHAKQQVKDTIEAYLATDEHGEPLLGVAQQRPVFLVGAPGIGKTAIMSQIADELDLGLVSYSMTHHTRQSALGLPYIVHRDHEGVSYDASEYTMSEIIASVYDLMEKSGRKRGILFLDEINCVSETLYPSMLQFLQFKTFGRHKVPEGWVVVTAGNPPEYNRSVHEFDVVTLDRVKRIEIEPDYRAWRDYAIKKDVHPAVLTFLDTKKDRFYSIETTLDGKSFVTARGWDDLSDMIRVYERLGKKVDEGLISHYVQNAKIAGEFAAYYELYEKYRDDYRIEEILAGEASSALQERAQEAPFDERLLLLGLLLDSIESEQREIMDRVDVLTLVRDDLRELKARAADDATHPRVLLERIIEDREKSLEMLVATGGATKARRRKAEGALGILRMIAARLESEQCDKDSALSLIETLFNAEAELDSDAARIEGKMRAAFDFIGSTFGEGQEMLVFVTELTQRTPSARFVAQFGSDSYYEHNQNMILSDEQRRLRSMVDGLEHLWEI